MKTTYISSEKNPTYSNVILPFYEDNIDASLIEEVSGHKVNHSFSGTFKEINILFHPTTEKTIYLLGLGKKEDFGRQHIAFRLLAHQQQKNWKKGISILASHLDSHSLEAVGLGLGLAAYKIGRFKTGSDTSPFFTDKFVAQCVVPKEKKELVSRGFVIAETLSSIMTLVDAPGNEKPPAVLAKWAEDSAKKHGYKASILNKKMLEKEGLHALLAVGQGSKFPPVLIKTEYRPKKNLAKIPMVGLVGKGITFDTGGLSIKGSQNLHYMKSDMGGAAAVLGAVELAARLKLNIHVVGIVASAENAVDANSYRPGDVIKSYSGKTIEIIDTDAEGRLVLADALAYMEKNYTPEHLIDLATLTGNAVMALGYSAGAMFSNNDELALLLSKAGEKVHERVWRLPLYDDFESELESDIADVRNFSGKPIAGAITAAKFLEYFVKEHPRWAHLDIAGVAFGDSEFSKMKSAKGFGPRLLLEVMEQLSEKS
ncbi:leucyl aminopeptidase family protein [Fulvivirga sedimenti]|uniref:Probable cytosol aminopeptidase n=1 Tax=Fulvivirga sedimenti TaxID=2879465 RepID=A0A9X1KZK8_9BACT|nr:leucyl aminopeptidase family protein [Fulvivirga sedimenti]MCA6075130.1 leucyl aminopeptidase family protein [Fulvivirga sedimenti]MCA6076307.1 leucyl aminopeptidase family protein [Fulvivirga sedimenti]MCA6077435.1 leucyl aminopeptidase family protein [Fulvivirga sedimenti]